MASNIASIVNKLEVTPIVRNILAVPGSQHEKTLPRDLTKKIRFFLEEAVDVAGDVEPVAAAMEGAGEINRWGAPSLLSIPSLAFVGGRAMRKDSEKERGLSEPCGKLRASSAAPGCFIMAQGTRRAAHGRKWFSALLPKQKGLVARARKPA